MFITSDSIVLVFTLGPEESRPFINAINEVCSSQNINYKPCTEPNTTNDQIKAADVDISISVTTYVDTDPTIPIVHGIQSIHSLAFHNLWRYFVLACSVFVMFTFIMVYFHICWLL